MRKFCLFIITLLLFIKPVTVHAYIPLNAQSAILTDLESGRVLYAHNEHNRMYPAGLTKMLTALVALQYLQPDDIIIVGNEVNNAPRGSTLSGHQLGEHITVHNLLRGLMIRNGNDSGVILAQHTVQSQRNRTNILYSAAMTEFAKMMNNLADELGAKNSNFVNPNGIHNDEHYTTAYDMALIAQAFMQNPLLAQIAEETDFTGNGLGGTPNDEVHTIDYEWIDANELISGGSFHYNYATGIRAGSTPQASDCLAASAYRNGVSLIAIVLSSQDPGRWQDARRLFDYGFSTYNYHTVIHIGEQIDNMEVSNAILGGESTLDVLSVNEFTMLLSQTQLSDLEREVSINEEYLAEGTDTPVLNAPITEGEIIGKIIYILDGQVVFEGEVKAASDIMERTLDSDMDYYISLVVDNVFSLRALPFWIGVVGTIIGVAGVSFAIAERRRSRRSWYRG